MRAREGSRWAGVRLFARAEQRVRWRSGLLLVAVVSVAIAAVVATWSAAARSEQAFERLRDATRSADVSIFEDAEEVLSRSDLVKAERAIAALDGVTAASAELELFVWPAGTELVPDFNLYARAPVSARSGAHVNVPVIVEGRPISPDRADEVALSENLAGELDVSVGDRLVLESATEAWVDVAYQGGDPGPSDGPRVTTTVVGITRTPADFGRWKGLLHLSPEFARQYGDDMRTYPRVEARVAAAARSEAISGLGNGVEISRSQFAESAATDDGLGTIATTLRLIGAAAALAGATVVGLILARLTRLTLRDRRALSALGWTSREGVSAALAVLGPWLAAGVVLGAVLGVFAAPQLLVGLAAEVDPAPNEVTAEPVLVVGVVAAGLLVWVLVIALAARVRVPHGVPARHPLPLLPVSRPVPVMLGLRRALGREQAQAGRTSPIAIAVMAAGAAGAVAALIVSASIERLEGDATLFGQGVGRVVDSGESTEVFDQVMPLLERDPRVSTLAGLHVSFDVRAQRREVTALILERIRGQVPASMVEGRLPHGRDEVALGPATLEALGKSVGEQLRLEGELGNATYRIVGSTLFPEGDFSFDDGVALTADGADAIIGDAHDTAAIHQVLFEWSPTVDAAAADRELTQAGFQVFSDNDNGLTPARVTNLGQVEALPRYLAILLGVLALATFGHVLAVGVTRRSHETATLQAIGLTRHGAAAIVTTQALTILGIAVVVGGVLGIAAGTQLWSIMAENAHVVVRTVTPHAHVAAFVAMVVITASVLTATQAWRTFKAHVADELRAE